MGLIHLLCSPVYLIKCVYILYYFLYLGKSRPGTWNEPEFTVIFTGLFMYLVKKKIGAKLKTMVYSKRNNAKIFVLIFRERTKWEKCEKLLQTLCWTQGLTQMAWKRIKIFFVYLLSSRTCSEERPERKDKDQIQVRITWRKCKNKLNFFSRME